MTSYLLTPDAWLLSGSGQIVMILELLMMAASAAHHYLVSPQITVGY